MFLQIRNIKKLQLLSFLIVLLFITLPFNLQATPINCPDSDNALLWGQQAISLFYGNQYLTQDRIQMGIHNLTLDEIVPVTNATVCNQLQTHIMQSSDFPQQRKDQSKVYFKNETTGRYFVTFYTDPPIGGWTTFVYVLDENFNKLGAFGV